MKYHNTLSDVSDNTYFRVVKPFEVFLLVGHSESNTYFGSSMALGNVYRRVTLKPGDEIQDLHGGVFAIVDGASYTAQMEISEKHPFEKVYSKRPEEWPVENLQVIPKHEAAQWSRRELKKIAPGKFVGRNIDSVLP